MDATFSLLIRRDVGHEGNGGYVERFRVGAVHRVSGAQQASAQILDVPAHEANAEPRARRTGGGRTSYPSVVRPGQAPRRGP